MGEEPIRRVLKSIGLTDKETDVYIFLAKQRALKGAEIAQRLKTDKAETYRILRSLQKKGVVELTLETPARFETIAFDKVIDSFVKGRKDEAALIENAKKDLMDDWAKIRKAGGEEAAEKFTVVEGEKKIYSRVLELVKETKKRILVILPVSDLLRAYQFGLLDALSGHTSKSKIRFQLLTEFQEKNAGIMKTLLEKMSQFDIDFGGRTPDLGLRLSPRMVIRDDEEILFFISPENVVGKVKTDTCLWTNCNQIVKSFSSVFEDLWSKSKDVRHRVLEIETGQKATERQFLFKRETVELKFEEAVRKVQKEIVVLTSADGFAMHAVEKFWEEALNRLDLSVKVMVPPTVNPHNAIQVLESKGRVRFASAGSLTSIVIDGRHLFQFGNSPIQKPNLSSSFESYLYTEDLEYVSETKRALDNMWKNASAILSMEHTTQENVPILGARPLPFHVTRVEARAYGRQSFRIEEYEEGTVSEKDIITEIITAKKGPIANDPTKDMNVGYGSAANVTIHPPSYLNLPDFVISVKHANPQSTWGEEDTLDFYLWMETPNGFDFVPVAHVTNNGKVIAFRKGVWANTPMQNNINLVKKDQLQIRIQGNTLFVGWTIPIPLSPPKYSLPPCCLLFEAYGPVKSGKYKSALPSGKTQIHKFNRFQAHVTFFHPASKYSEPGIPGAFDREHIMIAYPPPPNFKQ